MAGMDHLEAYYIIPNCPITMRVSGSGVSSSTSGATSFSSESLLQKDVLNLDLDVVLWMLLDD